MILINHPLHQDFARGAVPSETTGALAPKNFLISSQLAPCYSLHTPTELPGGLPLAKCIKSRYDSRCLSGRTIHT